MRPGIGGKEADPMREPLIQFRLQRIIALLACPAGGVKTETWKRRKLVAAGTVGQCNGGPELVVCPSVASKIANVADGCNHVAPNLALSGQIVAGSVWSLGRIIHTVDGWRAGIRCEEATGEIFQIG